MLKLYNTNMWLSPFCSGKVIYYLELFVIYNVSNMGKINQAVETSMKG